MMGGWGMMGGWMLLWSVLLLALVVLGIVLVVRRGRGDETPPPRPDALRVLEERFARGEIDRQEFEERRRTLPS